MAVQPEPESDDDYDGGWPPLGKSVCSTVSLLHPHIVLVNK